MPFPNIFHGSDYELQASSGAIVDAAGAGRRRAGGCGGGEATPAATPAAASDCPEPNPRLEVTSTEVNLFVWTEYIPQHTIDCFEEVYGITVNQSEYSSNEEMYAKLNAGGANYDLVQPTDYIVALMIRQGLLQELDKSTVADPGATLDPNYLDLSFDPGNRYTLPYQAGTDAIVVNTDAVETPPQSFADLWKPEYAGRLVMLDDSRAIIGHDAAHARLRCQHDRPGAAGGSQDEAGRTRAGVKLFDSDSPKTALIGGDVDLGIVWTGEVLLAQREPGDSVHLPHRRPDSLAGQLRHSGRCAARRRGLRLAQLLHAGDVFWRMLEEFPYTNPSLAALAFAKGQSPRSV
jgi:spermidine/putrescine-binding protein